MDVNLWLIGTVYVLVFAIVWYLDHLFPPVRRKSTPCGTSARPNLRSVPRKD